MKMVEILVAGMLAVRRLLLDSPMNSDKPEALSPHPPGNPSRPWRGAGMAGGGCGEMGWEGQGGGFLHFQRGRQGFVQVGPFSYWAGDLMGLQREQGHSWEGALPGAWAGVRGGGREWAARRPWRLAQTLWW